MDNTAFIIVATSVLAFGLFSARLSGSVVSAPMVFTAIGIALSPQLFGLSSLEESHTGVHLLAEVTLLLVLFTDASRIGFGLLRRQFTLPLRLLGLGMPLTIALGTGVAWLLFPDCDLWHAALMAAILAPTDAALGQAVVTNARVPVRIRQTLNVESGLNDGIALPVVLMFVAFVGQAGEAAGGVGWLGTMLQQIVVGAGAGVLIGYLGGQALAWGERRGTMQAIYGKLGALSVALLCYAGAEVAGGNGFIAAFLGGMTLGNTSRASCHCLFAFIEEEGQFLTLLAFLLFGTLMVWPAAAHWTWQTWVYAGLSLTVIRMVPVALSLLGSGLHAVSFLFIGWFGPRGLASILFALLLLEHDTGTLGEQVFAVIVATVLLSIVLHGVSAVPGAAHYAAYVKTLPKREQASEHQPMAEMPLRFPFRKSDARA